jgi:transposase-like protein
MYTPSQHPFIPQPKILLSKHERWRQIAKVLSLSQEAKTRLEWFIYHESHGAKNVSRTARHFGIHRDTFHHWHNRFTETNLRSLESHSCAPLKRRTLALNQSQVDRIIKLRKEHLLYGKMKLKAMYESEYGEAISSWHVQKVIKLYHLYPQRKPLKHNKRQIGLR